MADLARIKRNVAKMAGMNAPEADIDGYIASEGVTVDAVKAFKPTGPEPAPVAAAPDPGLPLPGGAATEAGTGAGPGIVDYASQGASGFNEGLARGAGAPVDIVSNLYNFGADLANKNLHTTLPQIERPVGGSEMFRNILAPTIAPPSADSGLQVVRRIGEEVGSAAVPIGGVAATVERPLASLASQVAATVGSGVGAAAAEQIAPGNPWVELAGEILGGAGVGGITKIARKIITPNPMSAERANAVTTMRREGVDLTAGQATGAKGLRYAESELGGAKVGEILGRQSRQFTRAALSRAGINADAATPEVLAQGFHDLGSQFDTLGRRNVLVPDGALGRDLTSAVHDYNALVPPTQRAPVVNNILGDIVTALRTNGGRISGESYQALRSRLDKGARASRMSDPHLSGALFDIRNALDGAMERGIAAHNPRDLGAWRQVRREYANLLTIEKAAAGGGENAGMGLISPAQLKSAAANQNHRAFTTGRSDFTDLAKAGQTTMTPMPESGTSARLAARGVANLPAIVGGVLGAHGTNDPVGATAGAIMGMAVPRAAGNAMLSDLGRRYLGNQAVTDPILDPSYIFGPLSAIGVNQSQQLARR